MKWEKYDPEKKYKDTVYLVFHNKYYTYPVQAFFDGESFVVGPHSMHLPANLPIVVTHICEIPEWLEQVYSDWEKFI